MSEVQVTLLGQAEGMRQETFYALAVLVFGLGCFLSGLFIQFLIGKDVCRDVPAAECRPSLGQQCQCD